MVLHYDSLYIGGRWVAPASAKTIDVVSASTEEPIGRVPEGTEEDIDAAARAAFDDPAGWSGWEPVARADAIERLAVALDARGEEMARRVSSQNGMPITIATGAEGAFPQLVLRYYANLIRTAVLDEVRDGVLGGKIRVRRAPVGVIGAIVPWNFPMTLAAFKVGPALAMGCTVVLKPSPETVLDAQLFAEAVDEAGFPPGVLNVVQGGREAGAHLVAHPGVDKIAFTGSTAAGRQIAETCGRLLRPVTLELGGKSASIVLDDADLVVNLDSLFGATLMNNGQTCYLGTRVLAPASRYDEVVDTLTAFAGGLSAGDALDPAIQIGPMASARQRDRVEGYIAKGLGRAPGSPPVAAARPGRRRAGSSSRRCSPTSTTAPPSRRRGARARRAGCLPGGAVDVPARLTSPARLGESESAAAGTVDMPNPRCCDGNHAACADVTPGDEEVTDDSGRGRQPCRRDRQAAQPQAPDQRRMGGRRVGQDVRNAQSGHRGGPRFRRARRSRGRRPGGAGRAGGLRGRRAVAPDDARRAGPDHPQAR
ncbi:hypothetical protein Amsp01_040760 [Amycolatopsis sp. NBRC 101858]|nr:hypothetical protein Amsp01_040760 [Amycolatopsis sp. NBRC 101858]